MPYIKQGYRDELDKDIDNIVSTLMKWRDGDQIDGCINYVFTRILKRIYFPKYKNINAAMGVLECVKQEYYRRVAAPYENIKIQENGDL